MATTPKRAPQKAEVAEPVYTITLTIAGETYTGTGATLVDAVSSLPRPVKLMHKGDVFITDGVKSNKLHFTVQQLKRLYYNKNFLNVRVKSLAMGMK